LTARPVVGHYERRFTMPKIIPDLGSRILQTAARHFETKGYAATDMKSLARELGASVGTLYNYYSSKPQLFLEVSLLWKQELNARLLDRLDREDSPAAKLRATLLMLYDDMESYTGLWREFMSSGAKFDPGSPVGRRFRQDNEQLHSRLQELFREVWRGHTNAGPLVDDPGNRLAQLVVGSIMQLVMNGTGDLAANRAFVQHWIDFVAPPSPAQRNGL
jgi:AcrR family transcriptional regulator